MEKREEEEGNGGKNVKRNERRGNMDEGKEGEVYGTRDEKERNGRKEGKKGWKEGKRQMKIRKGKDLENRKEKEGNGRRE